MFQICSYIQKVTLDLIETFKTAIYYPKHTQNTIIHLRFQTIQNKRNKAHIFKKKLFYVELYGSMSFVEGHTV